MWLSGGKGLHFLVTNNNISEVNSRGGNEFELARKISLKHIKMKK